MKYQDYAMHDKLKGNSVWDKGATIYQQQPTKVKAITDKEGLDRATAADNKLFVNGDTMYVAGTSNLQDVWDDFKIPFGKTAQSQRYKDADAILAKNSQVSNLVGHSLGGAAVLELQKNHAAERTFNTNTYGAPVMSMKTPDNVNNHRYRNFGDPISILDRGAESRVKGSVLKKFGEAAVKFIAEGEVDYGALYAGVRAAHSYDNFTGTQISTQSGDFAFRPQRLGN